MNTLTRSQRRNPMVQRHYANHLPHSDGARSNVPRTVAVAGTRPIAINSATGPGEITAFAYTRYSVLEDRDASIERQFESITEYASRNGIRLIGDHYSDPHKSGMDQDRENLRRMMAAIREGAEVNCIVIEDACRLSRDQVHLLQLYKELQSRGIELHCSSRGRLDRVSIAMLAFFGSEQWTIVRELTQAGRWQLAERLRRPSGRCFGYDSDASEAGLLVINKEQSFVVKLIFRFASLGVSPSRIAKFLNRKGYASPRGKTWSARAIYNPTGNSGILVNPIYVGYLVYGATEGFIDGNGAKRRRPTSGEPVRGAAEYLQIVPEILQQKALAAVSMRREAFKSEHGQSERVSRERLPVTGLLRCGTCGGALTVIRQNYTLTGPKEYSFVCSSSRRGSCVQRMAIKADYLLECALVMARESVCECDEIRSTIETLGASRDEAEKLIDATRLDLDTRKKQLEFELTQLVREARSGVPERLLAGHRTELVSSLSEVERQIAALPIPAALVLDDMKLENFKEAILRISSAERLSPKSEILAAALKQTFIFFVSPGENRGFKLKAEVRFAHLLSWNAVIGRQKPEYVVVKSFPKLRQARHEAHKQAILSMQVAREFASTDAEWEICKDLMPIRTRGPYREMESDDRLVLDVLLCYVRGGVPISCVSSDEKVQQRVRSGIQRMWETGAWHRMVAELDARSPGSLAGFDINLPYKFGPPGSNFRAEERRRKRPLSEE